MSNASQPKTTLASDGPQTAPETKNQPDQKECELTREELGALFEAAQKRASEMTDEEILKKTSWTTGVGPVEAMQALEEIEASNAGSDDYKDDDDDHDRDATEKRPRKTSTKQKY